MQQDLPRCRHGGYLTVTLPLPFKDSRRLGAGNPFVPAAGVALDVVGIELDEDLYVAWQARVGKVRDLLGWSGAAALVTSDVAATLAFEAPCEHLATAMEANEWALCAALWERDPFHWGSLRDALGQTTRGVGQSG